MNLEKTDSLDVRPLDRVALVQDLERLAALPAAPEHDLARETAASALQLLDEYDTVLRSLALSLSAGGYNSDGLIDPDVADRKIRWGIDYLQSTERHRAVASAGCPSADAGAIDPGTATPLMPFRTLAKLIVQNYQGCPDDRGVALGIWREVPGAAAPEFNGYLSVPMHDWRRYAEEPAPAARETTGGR